MEGRSRGGRERGGRRRRRERTKVQTSLLTPLTPLPSKNSHHQPNSLRPIVGWPSAAWEAKAEGDEANTGGSRVCQKARAVKGEGKWEHAGRELLFLKTWS